jgi:hypothetical protein
VQTAAYCPAGQHGVDCHDQRASSTPCAGREAMSRRSVLAHVLGERLLSMTTPSACSQ